MWKSKSEFVSEGLPPLEDAQTTLKDYLAQVESAHRMSFGDYSELAGLAGAQLPLALSSLIFHKGKVPRKRPYDYELRSKQGYNDFRATANRSQPGQGEVTLTRSNNYAFGPLGHETVSFPEHEPIKSYVSTRRETSDPIFGSPRFDSGGYYLYEYDPKYIAHLGELRSRTERNGWPRSETSAWCAAEYTRLSTQAPLLLERYISISNDLVRRCVEAV